MDLDNMGVVPYFAMQSMSVIYNEIVLQCVSMNYSNPILSDLDVN